MKWWMKREEKMKQVTAPLKQLLEQVRNGVNKIESCEKKVDPIPKTALL